MAIEFLNKLFLNYLKSKNNKEFKIQLQKAIEGIETIKRTLKYIDWLDEYVNKIDEKDCLEYYHSFNQNIKIHKDFIKALIDVNPQIYSSLSIPNDKEEIALYTIKRDPKQIQNIPLELRTREVYITAVELDGNLIKDFPEEYLKDREIIRKAVLENGNVIPFILERMPSLAKDKNMVWAFVYGNGYNLKYVDKKLLLNWKIVSTAYHSNPYSLQFWHSYYLENPENLISLNFIKFFVVSLENSDEKISLIKQNLLNHRSKWFSFNLELFFNKDDKWKSLFNEATRLNDEHHINIMDIIFELNSYLNFILPFWHEKSIRNGLKEIQKTLKEQKHAPKYINSKFLKGLKTLLQREFERRNIQKYKEKNL
jgi:hypothetical protein